MPTATSTTRTLWAPDLQTFCHMAKLPAAPNALSDAGYMFTLSGADLIRDIYAYCSELAERHVFDAAEVKPGKCHQAGSQAVPDRRVRGHTGVSRVFSITVDWATTALP